MKKISNRISIIRFIFCITLLASGLSAAEYFVAPDGKDSSQGSVGAPFKTFKKAVKKMKPGDTCFIRAGRYHETIKLKGLWESVDAPIIFKAYPNEKVVIDGTEPINSPWEKYKGNIYRTKIKKDIWQLFVGDKMMMPARWPNARLDDGSVWEQDKNWAHGSKNSEFGKMATRTEEGRHDLAKTNLDFTGAMAVLNIGKWQTHSRKVLSHKAGDNEFTYQADNPVLKDKTFWDNGYWEQTQRYYLECHLNCLDSEGEWYFDPKSKDLYLWAPGGGVPQNVRGQTMTYGFDADNVSYVVLKGLDFFACTFKFRNAEHCTIADHNWMGDVASQLRDVPNRDFRPRKGSQLVAKAYTVQGLTDKYWIRRREFGPYEFDCDDYWIPGYQTARSSCPIPADAAMNAKQDTDLIWLHGWQSVRANIYFGRDNEKVAKATPKSAEFGGHSRNNIFKPKEKLQKGQTYYWRADAIDKNGKTRRGKVWSFTVK